MNDADVSDVEMGPGMDLVISILAFVMLVLAVLALERKISNANSEAKPQSSEVTEKTDSQAANKREIERLNFLVKAQNEEIKNANEEKIQAEEKLKNANTLLDINDRDLKFYSKKISEKDGKNAVLTENLAISRRRAEILEKKVKAVALTLSILRKEKAEAISLLAYQLRQANDKNKKITDDTDEKVESLNQKIQSLQNLLNETNAQLQENSRRIPVELSDSGDLRIFESGKASLTAEGRSRFYRLIPELKRAIDSNQPNVLRVAGHASPERAVKRGRLNFDNNLQLSAERSLTIAYELASLGVSLRCISIEGHGRSRSPTLKDIHADFGLKGFDIAFAKQNDQLKQRFLRNVAGERRVEVLVTREKEGQCSHKLLTSGVNRADLEARNRLNSR